jgi:hypothetical protein
LNSTGKRNTDISSRREAKKKKTVQREQRRPSIENTQSHLLTRKKSSAINQAFKKHK